MSLSVHVLLLDRTVADVERKTIIVGLLVAYTAAMFILYTVAPILYRMASSAYYNLSLLSSDFYGLLFGLFLFVSTALPLALPLQSYLHHVVPGMG